MPRSFLPRVHVRGGARFAAAVLSLCLLLSVASVTRAANIRTAGPFSGTPDGGTVTLLDDGRILMFGGGNATIWDPHRRAWLPSMDAQRQPRRSLHTATQFGDDRVIFAGGLDAYGNRWNQQTALSSVTIWRPKQNIWEAGPGLLAPRFAHAAVALPSGEVLVMGGTSTADRDEPFGPFLATVELLGEKTTTARAPMQAARVHHTATVLKDGRVLVVGGVADDRSALAATELYDPKTDTWVAGPPLSIGRSSHATVLLPDGRVLVTGGMNSEGEPIARTEIWSGTSGQWQSGADLLAPRSGHIATVLKDGSVLVSGGVVRDFEWTRSLERLRSDASEWEIAGEVPLEMRGHRAVPLPDGSVLFFEADSYQRGVALIWLPDEKEDLRLDSAVNASLTELKDGRFLLVGGSRRQSSSASATLYDPRTNRWMATAPMHFARSGHRSTRLADGRVLVAGGTVTRSGRRERVGFTNDEPQAPLGEIWDPSTQLWTLTNSIGELANVQLPLDPREALESLPSPPQLHEKDSLRATRTADGTLLLFVGDRSTWLWNTEKREWISIAQDSQWSSVVDVVNAVDGRTLAFRHADLPGRPFQRLGVVWLNEKARRWQPITNDYVEREQPAMLALNDDEVMVAGGATAVVQIWNSRTAKWRYTGSLPASLRFPSILRATENVVMIAGKVSGDESNVVCASWNASTELWSECGRFTTDTVGERRPPVLRDLGAAQTLLVYGNERALVRSADGVWTATKLDFPKADNIPFPTDDAGSAFATDIGSVWDPLEAHWVDATDVLYVHRHSMQAARTPEGNWVFTNRGSMLQWNPKDRVLSRLALIPAPESYLDSSVLIDKGCALIWNGTRELGFDRSSGIGAPVMYARNFASSTWSSGIDAPTAPLRASAMVLKNGKVLLAGSSRDDVAGGADWQTYQATCDKVAALSPTKSVYFPLRPPRKDQQVEVAAKPVAMKLPEQLGYLETWQATAEGMVKFARRHIQSTLLFGGLLLLVLMRTGTRWGTYELDHEGRTPGRMIDLIVLAISLCALIASLGAPWPLPRTLVLIVAASAVMFAAKRLWTNLPAAREKVLYGVPLGACAVFCALAVGSVVAGKLFQIIDSLRDY